MTKDDGAPPSTRRRRGRAERQRGITKPPEHPDSVDHARKCGHAVLLKYLYEMSWDEVAATLWPVDENGEATKESKPMWNSGNSAFRAVKRFQQGHLIQNRDEVIEKALSQVSLRQAMLAPGVSRGDLFAIQQHRAETELLLKITGGCAPIKIAPTSPDGEKPYESPSDAAFQSLAGKLALLEARREEEVPRALDAGGSSGS